MSNNALEIKDLRKTFPGFSLDGLTLALPQGCIMGLVGENGAGKSSTMKLILGMLRADGGSITILGRDSGEEYRLTREEVGVVMDEPGIPEQLTAEQVGKVMARLYQNWDGTEYERLLRRLSLPENKTFKTFSRGMRMKLAIAIALSHGAKLLLLDEPTSGLDPVVRDEVVEMLMDFTRDEEHSILISSHIVSDLEKLCDHIAFLHRGRLLLCEEKDRLLEEYGILLCTAEQAEALETGAVLHRKETPYGLELLVRREAVPHGWNIRPVSIEELFIQMVKEAK